MYVRWAVSKFSFGVARSDPLSEVTQLKSRTLARIGLDIEGRARFDAERLTEFVFVAKISGKLRIFKDTILLVAER